MPTMEQLEQLLTAEPGDAFVLYAIALKHAEHGRYAEAVSFFDRCLGADADYSYAYFHKARALDKLGNQRDAVGVLKFGLDVAVRVGDEQCRSETAAYLAELGE